MAVVGLLESLMTAKLVDDITDTHSRKTREAWGQGAANMLSGLFGGMGGCAMIGQTMINVKASGARTRISTFLAGVFVLILVVALGDIVALIPMAALVAVMIVVAIATFDWHSIRPATLKRMPISETGFGNDGNCTEPLAPTRSRFSDGSDWSATVTDAAVRMS